MINLENEYSGQVEAANANYVFGGFKNEVTPGAFDGTPFERAYQNDINAFLQGLANAAAITPSGSADTVPISQLLQGLLHQISAATHFVDTGAADAYVIDALTDHYNFEDHKAGQEVRFTPDNVNTGASTVDVSGLAQKDIKTPAGNDPLAGDIPAGIRVTLQYDLANDWYTLISVATGGATTGILTEAFTSAEQAIVEVGSLALTHSLSKIPYLIRPFLICKTAELGYSIGDEVAIDIGQSASSTTEDYGMSVVPDATDINVRYGISSRVFLLLHKTTGVATVITLANWRLIIRAWA